MNAVPPVPPFAGAVARCSVEGVVLEWLAVPPRASALDLEPHPEGGWYRRTWTSCAATSTPGGERPAATLILFLLPPGEASAWHRVTSDEIWLWHGPDPVLLELGGDGEAPGASTGILLDGSSTQGFVPAGVWQRTVPSDGEALVSCVVSPGFSFADFTLAD
ncbi:cupin domain-containing protein [Frondihabitans sp. Leaf304]|uniref:cupin domain-containing protein n=1 Tax=Frondihabitans sp. Leaf304 TaxID=1736329 RepID=UPI0009FBD3CF|nr:cupin domain-containing protein [Frondihabitans sp. Leaf304]